MKTNGTEDRIMAYPKIRRAARFLTKTALGLCALAILVGILYLIGTGTLDLMIALSIMPESVANSGYATIPAAMLGLMLLITGVLAISLVGSFVRTMGNALYTFFTERG
jgi:hypothetical protein